MDDYKIGDWVKFDEDFDVGQIVEFRSSLLQTEVWCNWLGEEERMYFPMGESDVHKISYEEAALYILEGKLRPRKKLGKV
jgi:hypothetical protein